MSGMLKRKWDDFDSDSSDSGKRSRYSDRSRRLEIDARNVPEKVLSNLYCKMCDSHMNSANMWAQHVSGKRHLKNLKKGPDETPSKVKSVPCNDVSRIQKELDEINQPIVGLDYICETRRADPDIAPFFSCVLCQGTFTVLTIIEHLLSQKHRMSYLKKEYKSFHQLDSIKLNKDQLFDLVEEQAAEMEDELGRGTITVKVEKTNGQLPLSYIPLVLGSKSDAAVRSSHDRVPSPAPSSVSSGRSSWLPNLKRMKAKYSTTKDYEPLSKPSTSRDTASSKSASRKSTSSKSSTSRDPFLSKPSTSKDSFLSKPSTSKDSFLSKPSTSKDSFLSKPSTSRDSFLSKQSTSRDSTWSKASTSKISSTVHVPPPPPPPPRVLAPEEIDWDLERDAKYLTTDQKRAILETIEKRVVEDPDSFDEPGELDVLAEYIRISIGQNLVKKIMNSTPEQKKIIYKNLYTDHPRRMFWSEFKRHSVI